MKPKKPYTNRFGRKMLLVERIDKRVYPDPSAYPDILHDYPVKAGATIELPRIKGVRRTWRIWREE